MSRFRGMIWLLIRDARGRRTWGRRAAVGGLARWVSCLTIAGAALLGAEPQKVTGLMTPGRRASGVSARPVRRFPKKRIRHLAQENPEDARLRFNAGAAAYRQNDLTNAAKWFESAATAPT